VFGFYRTGQRYSNLPRAMTWYVSSNNGSDANNGRSANTAFKTFSRAAEAAKAGDTIQIAPGAYDQDLAARVSAARTRNIVVLVAGGH
jgi:Protein of unknown function (DUF1565)